MKMYEPEEASDFYNSGFPSLAEDADRAALPPSPRSTYALRTSPVVLQSSSPYLMPSIRPRILPSNPSFFAGEPHDFNPCANLEAVGWINPRSPRMMEMSGWALTAHQLPLYDTIHQQMVYPLRRSPFFDYELAAQDVNRDCSFMQVTRERSPFAPLSCDDRGLCEATDIQQNEAHYAFDKSFQPILVTNEEEGRMVMKQMKQKRKKSEKNGKESKDGKKGKKEKTKGKEEKKEEKGFSETKNKPVKGKREKKEKVETQSLKIDGDKKNEYPKEQKKRKKLRFSTTVKEKTIDCSNDLYNEGDTFSVSDSEVNFLLPNIDSDENFRRVKNNKSPEFWIQPPINDENEECKNKLVDHENNTVSARKEILVEVNNSSQNQKETLHPLTAADAVDDLTLRDPSSENEKAPAHQENDEDKCVIDSVAIKQTVDDSNVKSDIISNENEIVEKDLQIPTTQSESLQTEINPFKLDRWDSLLLLGDESLEDEVNEYGSMIKDTIFYRNESFLDYADNDATTLTSCSGEFTVTLDEEDLGEKGNGFCNKNEYMVQNNSREQIFKPIDLNITQNDNVLIEEKPEIGTQTDFDQDRHGDDDEKTNAFTQTVEDDSLPRIVYKTSPDERTEEPCCSYLDQNYNKFALEDPCIYFSQDDQKEELKNVSLYVKECDAFGTEDLKTNSPAKRNSSEEFVTLMEQNSEPFLDARSLLYDSSEEEEEKQSLHYAECLEISASDEGLLQESPEEFNVKLDKHPRRAISACVIYPKQFLNDQRYSSLSILPRGKFVDLRDDVTQIRVTEKKTPSFYSKPKEITVDETTRLNAGEGFNQTDVSALLEEQTKAKADDEYFQGLHRYLLDKVNDNEKKQRIREKINSNPETQRSNTNDEVNQSPVTSSLPNIPLLNKTHICRNKCINECKKALLVCECFWREDSGTRTFVNNEDDKEMEDIVKDITENLLDYMKEISQHVTKYSSKSSLMKSTDTESEEIITSNNTVNSSIEIPIAEISEAASRNNDRSKISPTNFKETSTSNGNNQKPPQQSRNEKNDDNVTNQNNTVKDIVSIASTSGFSTLTRKGSNNSTEMESSNNLPANNLPEELHTSKESPTSITINVGEFIGLEESHPDNNDFAYSESKFKIEIDNCSSQDDYPLEITLHSEKLSLGSKKDVRNEGCQTESSYLKCDSKAIESGQNEGINISSHYNEVNHEDDTPNKLLLEDDIDVIDTINLIERQDSDDRIDLNKQLEEVRKECLKMSNLRNLNLQMANPRNTSPGTENLLNQKLSWETNMIEPSESKKQNFNVCSSQADQNFSKELSPIGDSKMPEIEKKCEKESLCKMRERNNEFKLSLLAEDKKDKSGDQSVCLKKSFKKQSNAETQTEYNMKNSSTQTSRFKMFPPKRGKGKEVLMRKNEFCFRSSAQNNQDLPMMSRRSQSFENSNFDTSSEESLPVYTTENGWNRISDSTNRRLQLVNAVERLMAYRTINGDEGLAEIDIVNLDLDMWPLEAIAHVLYLIVIIGFFILLSTVLSVFYTMNI